MCIVSTRQGTNQLRMQTNHVLSFIRQSFSHSPLSISHDLFEGLLSEFSIPCNIKDFALSFGAKNDEDSICPPPCRIHVEHDEVDLKIIGRLLADLFLYFPNENQNAHMA